MLVLVVVVEAVVGLASVLLMPYRRCRWRYSVVMLHVVVTAVIGVGVVGDG